MEIYFIFLGFLVFQLNSSQISCQDENVKPFVTCYEYLPSCYILEGNEEDYSKLKHIDTQIIKPSFIIPMEEEPIVIRIFDFLDQKKKIQEKLMCSLFRKFEYSIACISVDLVYLDNQITFNENLRFDTKIISTELCNEMDINEDESLNLFCLSQYTLKQYTLNLQRKNVTLILEHDVTDQLQNNCKMKQVKWKEDLYIVAFYQCSSWKIISIKNNEINTLLQSEMKEYETLLQRFSFINDISFCVRDQIILILYLIENTNYLQVQVNSKSQFILNYILYEHTTRIHKVLVQIKCQTLILINSLEDTKIINNSKINEITLNLQYSNYNIYLYSDILFLQQNQSELNVFLNVHINQTYQINNTTLHFFEFDKLFCQFDQSKNGLQFYRYYQLNSFIKPKLKYLFLIQRKDLFKNDTLFKCIKMVYENNTQEDKSKLVEQITVQHICQNKLQQKIEELEAQSLLKNSPYNLYNSESSISVSILNNQKIMDSCLSKLQSFIGKIEIRQIKIPDFISFQNETYFYIYDCRQTKILISINRDQFEVLESQSDYYIVYKNNNNLLRIIQLQNDKLLQQKIKFDETIISAQQISQSLFLYMNNSNLPPLIFQNFHSNINKKYLSKSLYQSEPILFYFEVGLKKIIQYSNVIAIENQVKMFCLKFQQGLIISIKFQAVENKGYSILVIQNLTQSVILNFFNENALLQISNYTFSDYSFYYPFKYKKNPLHLAILMKQNNELYIAIFSYNLYNLKLQQIIATDDFFFTFYQSDLLYSSNKEWKYLLMNQILIEVETKTNLLNNLSSIYYTDLYSTKQEDKGIQLTINIQNNCYQIYSLKNLSKFEIQQNQILTLNVSDIFYGPINRLILVTNSSIFLNGPFQLKQYLQSCSLNISNFCSKQYQIQNQAQLLKFEVFIIENQVFEIINTYPKIKFIYITLIKQNYYLMFLTSENNLKIQLIQCFGEICNVIQDINENLKIQPLNQTNIVRTGDLIKLKNEFNQIFIYFEDTNFILVQIPEIVLDVIYIEESQNQYLFLQQNITNSINLELIIYSIHLNQKSILYSLTISEELYIQLTNNKKSYFQELKLTSCIQIGDLTKIKLFIITQFYSYLFQLILNQQKNQIQFELQKSIRNFDSPNIENEKFTINYFDDNFLVLKKRELLQFYDLREERNFYDYFHKSYNSIKIKRINTTHFIFLENLIIYLGTIGYEIELQSSSEINYNFELHAQNDISNEKASFQIHIIKQKNQFTTTIILIQLSCFIFIIIYLRNLKLRILKQSKRKRTFQVSQIRDI